ncbi:MAG: cupin domain-containing protein [Candidatus Latescibacterota bacterium]|nr:MAG: cupin domain-containing protein [Candidatus Latescibacterota bacterium]
MSDYRVEFDTLSWETPMRGLRLKALRSGGKQLRLAEYTPAMEPHWCEKGHYGYMLEGEFEIAFDDETTLFKPGDGVFIPPGAEHRHMGKALTDVVRVIFVEDI